MSTHAAADASYAAVLAAYNACAEGDTLVIPAGTATWGSTLTVAKGITIQGAGGTATVITASNPASTSPLIALSPGADKPQRVTGIGFVGGRHINVSGANNGSYCLTQVRVDHCKFSSTTADAMWVTGWVEGLIDHCDFLNTDRGILLLGDDSLAWAREITAGTQHALFIEDCTFTTDSFHSGMMDYQIYHQQGARSVTRHCIFDSSAASGIDGYVYDTHGSQDYLPGGAGFRGQPITELYECAIHLHHSWNPMHARGGSILVHDLVIDSVGSVGDWFQLEEEEAWQSSWFDPLRTVWPAQDQIANSFFWSNTLNGADAGEPALNTPASEATFIQRDRDYFMHAPAAIGGKTSYTGARNGGSQSAPTEADTGSAVFSSSGPNAYYPYTPYQYPHPLAGGGGGGGSVSPAHQATLQMIMRERRKRR